MRLKNSLKDFPNLPVTPLEHEQPGEGKTMNTMTMSDTRSHFRAENGTPQSGPQKSATARQYTLGQAVQAAVDLIEDPALKPFSQNAHRPLAQARIVLALLAQCYAQQTYSSIAVAALAARDPVFPWPWWEELPDARALRRFRETQREAIQLCLMAALRFQAEQKVLAGVSTKVDSLLLAGEAGRRITMAAFVDSMQLDGE
jgi:hypothetical protein